MKPLALLLTTAFASLPSAAVFAQAPYPSKPVRMIVGFPPGGSTDIMARLIAPGLTEAFRQQFAIDNRPGANSNIGNELAARSAPDGYTLLVVSASFSTNVSLYPKMGYDPLRDFAPITRIAAVHNMLVVHPSLPVKTVKQLVTLAKARPGQLIFASSGGGSTSHLAAELLKTSVGGLDTIHVPYKGVAPALVDLIAGNTQALISTMPSATPHVKSGRLRAIAVASLKRAATFPELPTFDESGFAGFEASAWNAVLAPAGTPREIINSLNAVIVRTVKSADSREKFAGQGAEPVGDSPEQFGAYLRAEVAKWAKVIKASGAKLD
ncbi:MAG: tripartite tricarboxylate transporter substrate binding protein [Betaproteobacteria bacterium]|jgi:tripartite-type tricarboxylate transporter receptor subunit TctC|nr:tripartite tricarboxylate transporter substrate binding protein [Betaproteobacteria bacterium]